MDCLTAAGCRQVSEQANTVCMINVYETQDNLRITTQPIRSYGFLANTSYQWGEGSPAAYGGARGVKEFSHGFLSDDGVFLCEALNTH